MERALAELIRRASPRVDFVVIASTLAEPLRPLVRWHRVPAPRRPFALKFLIFYALAGLRLLRTNADLVHTTGAIVPNNVSLATVHVCQAAWVVATGHLAPKEAPLFRRVNTSLVRLLAVAIERRTYRPQRLRVLAAVSEGGRAALLEHYPDVRVAVTPNGVDMDRFRPDAATRTAVRSAERVGRDDVVALFVGGDWDRKRLGIAIAAVAHARQGGAPLTLWVVGRGNEHRFRDVAAQHGVADSVHFFGHRRDPQRFYQAADVFVLPTEYETFSLVALEAAATGLPIVATQVGGAVDAIGAEGGLLVAPTPKAVGDALLSLAGDANLRERMGSAGQRRAASFSWHHSAESVLRLYGELLGAPLPPTSR